LFKSFVDSVLDTILGSPEYDSIEDEQTGTVYMLQHSQKSNYQLPLSKL
jgi:hypothetical protein